MFCFDELLSAIRELILKYFAKQEKIQQMRHKLLKFVEFPKKREKNPVNNNP